MNFSALEQQIIARASARLRKELLTRSASFDCFNQWGTIISGLQTTRGNPVTLADVLTEVRAALYTQLHDAAVAKALADFLDRVEKTEI